MIIERPSIAHYEQLDRPFSNHVEPVISRNFANSFTSRCDFRSSGSNLTCASLGISSRGITGIWRAGAAKCHVRRQGTCISREIREGYVLEGRRRTIGFLISTRWNARRRTSSYSLRLRQRGAVKIQGEITANYIHHPRCHSKRMLCKIE